MAIAVERSTPTKSTVRWLDRPRQREAFWGVLCVTPAILGFVLWEAGPMIASLFISFTDWRAAGSPQWIGLDNFQAIFSPDRLFLKALSVTLVYALVSVPARVVFALALALLLNQKIVGLPFFRTIFYLPSIMPLIATSVVWLWLFNPDFGLFNSFLDIFGIAKQQWIYNPDTVLPSLVLMSLWDIGPMMIVFLAGLQGVPRHLYDAVEVDGGTFWHRFWAVTVPMMTPTILLNLVLSVIHSFQTFVQAYVMTDGGPNNGSLFYGFYLYRKAFEEGQLGYASALGWILFVIIAVISVLIFRSSNRWVYYEGEA